MVYILYENTAFLIDDFLENFAPSMAVVSKTWPVCAFGTASNQETVRLSAVISREHRTDTAEGDFIELVQQSISGKEADDLQTLCLQVECPEHETAEKLAYLLGCVNWRTNIAVIPWSKMSVLSMQRLVDPNIRSFFCYIGADSCMAPDDFLRSLNFPQKVALWRAFFKGKDWSRRNSSGWRRKSPNTPSAIGWSGSWPCEKRWNSCNSA